MSWSRAYIDHKILTSRVFNVAHLYNVDSGGQEKAWNENLGNVGFVDFGKLNPKRSWTEPLQNK